MNITEAKIGQKVTFKHKGKMVKGVIIHRHDSQQDPSLRGVVNVSTGASKFPMTLHISKLKPVVEDIQMEQLLDEKKKHKKKKKFKLLIGKQNRLDVDGDEKIEKSDLKKLRKAKKKGFDTNKDGKTDARDFRKSIKEGLASEMMTDIIKNNSVEAQEKFDSLMAEKVTELLNHAKVVVADSIFNTPCSDCQDEVNEQQVVRSPFAVEPDRPATSRQPRTTTPRQPRTTTPGSARYSTQPATRESQPASSETPWKRNIALAGAAALGLYLGRKPLGRLIQGTARLAGRAIGAGVSEVGGKKVARTVMSPRTPLPPSVRQGAMNVYRKQVAPEIATLRQQAAKAPTQADINWSRRWNMPEPTFPAGQPAKPAEFFSRQARRLETPARQAERSIERQMRAPSPVWNTPTTRIGTGVAGGAATGEVVRRYLEARKGSSGRSQPYIPPQTP